MNNNYSKFLPIMIWIIIGTSCADQKNHNNITEKIKKIELGMHKHEVIKLLGEPRNIVENEVDGISYVGLLYEPSSKLDSIIPSVIICKETGLVVEVVVDESGKYNKRDRSSNPCKSPSAEH